MTYLTLFRNKFLRLFTLYFLKKDVDFLRVLFQFFSCISPSISSIHFYVALCLSGVSTFGIWCWGTKSRWCWRIMETFHCAWSQWGSCFESRYFWSGNMILQFIAQETHVQSVHEGHVVWGMWLRIYHTKL